MLDRQMQLLTRSGLVAGMVAFRSTLGQRVERLLVENTFSVEVGTATRFRVLTCLTLIAMTAAALVPQAIAQRQVNSSDIQTSFEKGNTMKSQLSTLAVLIGLSAPLGAEEPQDSKPVQQAAELKASPDDLVRRFSSGHCTTEETVSESAKCFAK